MKENKRKPYPGGWTEQEIKILKKHFPKKDNEEIAGLLNKSVRAIRNKAFILRLKKSDRYWGKPEQDFVLKNYMVMSAEEIGEKLKKTKWAVINKYRELTGKR